MVKSVSYSQEEILNWIIRLHCPEGIVADVCYSKGNFYKGAIEEPKYKFDIEPKNSTVIKADCRRLPIENEFLRSISYDPPFLATKGKSLKENNDSNKIVKRFSCYETEQELHQFYIDSLKEFYRVLKDKGILIVKCQDKVSSGKQYWSHIFIQQEAEKLGFYTKDLFILLAKNRITANWQLANQKHARKFHSYFWVFEKSNKKVAYVQE